MKIKKGDLLEIIHTRKGNFMAFAKRDFDTEKEEFFPVILAKGSPAKIGIGTAGALGLGLPKYEWEKGDEIPCRASFVLSLKRVNQETIKNAECK